MTKMRGLDLWDTLEHPRHGDRATIGLRWEDFIVFWIYKRANRTILEKMSPRVSRFTFEERSAASLMSSLQRDIKL